MRTEDNGAISFEPGEFPVEKRGYFMGWMSQEKEKTYHYASYRDAEAVKDMAPDLMRAAYGPLFPLIHYDNYAHILDHVKQMEFDGDRLEVYTHENSHGVIFFSNHIPQHPEVTYELVADHSECTPDHCKGEDVPE